MPVSILSLFVALTLLSHFLVKIYMKFKVKTTRDEGNDPTPPATPIRSLKDVSNASANMTEDEDKNVDKNDDADKNDDDDDDKNDDADVNEDLSLAGTNSNSVANANKDAGKAEGLDN